LERSLTVVLPVYNAPQKLQDHAPRLLEMAAELTSAFEVLIIDDGSTDQTDDIARDLARRFPQVKSVRHAKHQGQQAAVEAGLKRATGDVVFVHDVESPISEKEMHRMWALRNEDQLVMAEADRSDAPSGAMSDEVVLRLMSLRDANSRKKSGLQMIRRVAAEELTAPPKKIDSTSEMRIDPDDRDVSGRRPPNFLARVKAMANRVSYN